MCLRMWGFRAIPQWLSKTVSVHTEDMEVANAEDMEVANAERRIDTMII